MSLLSSQVIIVFKTRCYCKFARHILCIHTKNFWYFEDESCKPSEHDFEAARPGECCSTVSTKQIDINSTKTQKRGPVAFYLEA